MDNAVGRILLELRDTSVSKPVAVVVTSSGRPAPLPATARQTKRRRGVSSAYVGTSDGRSKNRRKVGGAVFETEYGMGIRTTRCHPSQLRRCAFVVRPSQMRQMADRPPTSRSRAQLVKRGLIGVLGPSVTITETTRPDTLDLTDVRSWTLAR